MKLSELIKQLQEIQSNEADYPVASLNISSLDENCLSYRREDVPLGYLEYRTSLEIFGTKCDDD